ncbi:MAG: FAD-binding oxidoreductase [bacterium]
MTHQEVLELSGIVGKQSLSSEEIDILLHSGDLAPLPESLSKVYGIKGPEVLVFPGDVEQVSQVLKFASKRDIPVTPRGAATTATGAAIPVEGGIALDLFRLSKIVEFNPADEYITVGAGSSWKRIVDFVEKRGFQLGGYPSSAPSATVGGWLGAGASAGVGVPEYGPAGEAVLSLKVVLPDGSVCDTGPREAWLFIGSEGTLGVICEVTLKIYPKTDRRYFMYGFDSLGAGVRALDGLWRVKPYFLTTVDYGLAGMLNEVGMHMPLKPITIVGMIDGDKDCLQAKWKRVEEICREGKSSCEKSAEEEWENRFKVGLSFKTLGPSLMALEIRIPVPELLPLLGELRTILREERWGVETLQGDHGTISAVIYMLADEREKVAFLKKFSYIITAARLAFKHGGFLFGVGLHNTSHMNRLHGEAFEFMRLLKAEADPKEIMNPSKTVQVRMPYFMLAISMGMMRGVPGLVLLGMETAGYLPLGLLRFGLGLIGEGVR